MNPTLCPPQTTKTKDREARANAFVSYVIELWQKDTGAAAALRRADNPDTEFQSWQYLWGYLATLNLSVQQEACRLPYTLVAATIVKAKITHNGSTQLGTALAHCYPDGSKNSQAQTKLRRLLACKTVKEVCEILRPLLSLIISRNESLNQLDVQALLNDLIRFNYSANSVKAKWAQSFYSDSASTQEE